MNATSRHYWTTLVIALCGLAMSYKIFALLLAGLVSTTEYGDNYVSVRKDEPQVEASFPDPGINLVSPAFLNERSISSGFSNGTSGPTSDEILDNFVRSLVDKNDWMAYAPAKYVSEEGRDFNYVYLSTSAMPDNLASIKSSQKARVWVQGGVHGNEPAGDQSVLALLGKMDANQTWAASILENVDILVLPRYNPDGVAYFQRTLATNFDPNRDHIKLARQQTREIKKTLSDFGPHVAVDMHEYTATTQLLSHGKVYVPGADALFSAAKNLNINPAIRNMSEHLFAPSIGSHLESKGLRWEPYVTLSSGRVSNATIAYDEAGSDAKIGRNAMGLTQAIVFLCETRGIGIADQEFARRTASGLTMLESIIQTTADHAAEVIRVVGDGIKDFAKSSDEIVITDYTEKTQRNWTFVEHDSGNVVQVPVEFFSTTPVIANLTRSRPAAYIIPRAWSDLADRLRVSGLEIEKLSDKYRGSVEALTITSSIFASSYYEGSILATVTTNSTIKEVELPAGSFRISTKQRNAGLAFVALEPENIDSYVSTNIVPLEVGDEYPVFRER